MADLFFMVLAGAPAGFALDMTAAHYSGVAVVPGEGYRFGRAGAAVARDPGGRVVGRAAASDPRCPNRPGHDALGIGGFDVSLWSRIASALHGDRLSREINLEFQSHYRGRVRAGPGSHGGPSRLRPCAAAPRRERRPPPRRSKAPATNSTPVRAATRQKNLKTLKSGHNRHTIRGAMSVAYYAP